MPKYLLLALIISISSACAAEPVSPDRDFSKTLIFGASVDYFPYSYLGGDGQLEGFTIDLTNAVARAMNLKVSWKPLANSDLSGPLNDGSVDAVPFISETPGRDSRFDFSVPVVELDVGVVVRSNDTRIHRLMDLQGMRIAVGHQGSHGERILGAFLQHSVPVYTEGWTECLRMLEQSKCDGAIMTRMTAIALIDRLGIKDLRVMDSKLTGYPVRYAFAVRRGDSLLLARYNEGLVMLHDRGEFDEIYQRWFGRYEKQRLTQAQVLLYLAVALAFGFLVASIAFLRQKVLSRRISIQAAELIEQRALLSTLFQNHPLATVVLDIEPGRSPSVVSLNREACRLFNLDPIATPDNPLDSLPLSSEFKRFFEELIGNWQKSSGTFASEMRLPAKRLFLETTVIGIGSAFASRKRVCVLTADVTRRRMIDQEVTQARRVRALGELVGGIAHEFNNLLTPILATANLLKLENPDNALLANDLGLIEQASLRAANLTQRLLTFGRRSLDQPDSVRLSDVVANCFALIQPTIDRRIVLKSNVPESLPPIVANPTDLNQILFNLIVNSRDALLEKLAGPGNGEWIPELRVDAKELPPDGGEGSRGHPGAAPSGWLQITVEDNGPGISAEIIDRVFDPFFTTKEVGKGTGLGLSTVWHLVSGAGGKVHAESNVGKGARFVVLLPRYAESDETERHPGPEAAPRASAPGQNALVVEDDPLVARTTAGMLERLGSRVTIAEDGDAAWKLLSPDPGSFSLLVVDVNLPKMNGVDFVRLVRGTPFSGRIIMTSGNLADEDVSTLHQLGIDRILPKPFALAEFTAALN